VVAGAEQHSGKRRGDRRRLQEVQRIGRMNGQASVQKGGSAAEAPRERRRSRHHVHVGRAEIGAAWSKRSNEGRDYLSVKLDDSRFNAPIYANPVDDDGGVTYTLIWAQSRRCYRDCNGPAAPPCPAAGSAQ
jgi:uncharacterized protein (DUF736 family)